MKRPLYRWLLSIPACLLLVPAGISAVGESYVPLFVIERSLNKNVVHYDARLSPEGRLDPHQPVIAYWVMAAEDGRRKDLNYVERSRAYGFTTEAASNDSYYLRIVSEKARPILVTRAGEAIRAQTNIAGHRAYLRRIFITARRSVLPLPESAELYGDDIETGQPRYEKIAP